MALPLQQKVFMSKAVMIASFASLVLACSAEDPKPSPTASQSATEGTGTPSAVVGSAPPSGAATTTARPSTQEGDRLVVAEPTTCEGLAALTTPAATFEFHTIRGGYGQAFTDVYVTRTTTKSPVDSSAVHSLSITLTETLHQCAWRNAKLGPSQMNETSISVVSASPFAPGDYTSSIALSAEAGGLCPPADGGGFTGTALSAWSAAGKVTITSISETKVEGSIDVTDAEGKNPVKLTFSAPICPEVPLDTTSCCGK